MRLGMYSRVLCEKLGVLTIAVRTHYKKCSAQRTCNEKTESIYSRTHYENCAVTSTFCEKLYSICTHG